MSDPSPTALHRAIAGYSADDKLAAEEAKLAACKRAVTQAIVDNPPPHFRSLADPAFPTAKIFATTPPSVTQRLIQYACECVDEAWEDELDMLRARVREERGDIW